MKLLILTTILAGCAVLASAQRGENITLDVPGYAKVIGRVGESVYTQRPYYAFRGVHYAEAPLAEDRFLPPKSKVHPADTVVDATALVNPGCTQWLGDNFVGEEDCLSVDIYTPVDLPGGSIAKLPVMVWIHGGSFRSGQSLEYQPIRYMEKDIVLVVIQYRLGPIGFLCLDTDEIPGNAGIFDQIEALRWVQKYITHFGGDPAKVTIAGESAGSASVSLLLLAPQAEGLFVGAIGESGSVLAEWAIDADGKTPSTRIAEIAGCPLEPYADLLQCLRTIEAGKLIEAYKTFWKEDQKQGGLGFGGSNPVIQKAGKDRIIEVSPRTIFDSGNYSKVPMMFGANQQEGTLVLTYLYRDFLLANDLLENTTFLAEDLIPTILTGLNIRDDTGTFTDALIDKYFVGAEMGNFTSMTPGLIDMLGALFLKQAGLETVRIHSKHQPNSYWYGFNYEGRLSLYPYLFPGEWEDFPWDHGVSHADEMIYLFAIPFPYNGDIVEFNAEERELSDRMINAWTNFVITGSPNTVGANVPRWPEYTRADDLYMDIDKDWVVRKDYTQTYTVTVDEMRPPA